MSRNPFENPESAASAEKQDQVLISEIPEISDGAVAVRSREDLRQVVEAPLLDACQSLYDLNIQTLMSSANGKDIGDGAYIDIDFDSLSEENREVALKIGSKGMMHGSSPTPYVKITFPTTPTTTVSDIKRAAQEAISKFNKQPLTWGRYTREDLAGMFGMAPEDINPEDWSETYPYEPETGYFYNSEELLQKAKDS